MAFNIIFNLYDVEVADAFIHTHHTVHDVVATHTWLSGNGQIVRHLKISNSSLEDTEQTMMPIRVYQNVKKLSESLCLLMYIGPIYMQPISAKKNNDFWGIFLAWPPVSSFWPFKREKRLQNASKNKIFKNWLDTRPKMLNA